MRSSMTPPFSLRRSVYWPWPGLREAARLVRRESSHAVAYAMKLAKTMRADQSILINLSGRGDKDIGTVADLSNADFYCRPSCQGQGVKGGVQPLEFKP